MTDYKARITLQRLDGSLFDLMAFSAQLLANTAGAGGSIEIMPLVDGEDAFNDPLYFNVTGYYGFIFSFDESPNPWGSTAALKGFDTYKIGLYVDFALTALTLEGAPVPGMLGDYNQNDTIDAADYTGMLWRTFACQKPACVRIIDETFVEPSCAGLAYSLSGGIYPTTPLSPDARPRTRARITP